MMHYVKKEQQPLYVGLLMKLLILLCQVFTYNFVIFQSFSLSQRNNMELKKSLPFAILLAVDQG